MTYRNRIDIEKGFIQLFKDLFSSDFRLLEFGSDVVLTHDLEIKTAMTAFNSHKQVQTNNYDTNYALAYLPDFILWDKCNNQLFFIETKISLTPLSSLRRISLIKKIINRPIEGNNIGQMNRDAFYAYKKFYPNTIIIAGVSYNKEKLLAQKISNLNPIFVKADRYYSYQEMKNKEIGTDNYYPYETNAYNSGSGKPWVNLDLDEFIGAEQFFIQELNIKLNAEVVKKIKAHLDKI